MFGAEPTRDGEPPEAGKQHPFAFAAVFGVMSGVGRKALAIIVARHWDVKSKKPGIGANSIEEELRIRDDSERFVVSA